MDDFSLAISLFGQGYSLRKIEKITGINRKKLSKYLKELGFNIESRVGNSGYNKYLVFEEAKKRYLESGMKGSITKICTELHTTPVSFTRWLRKQGFHIESKINPRDEKLETSKLEQAMKLKREGYTLYEISRLVKINSNKLSDYLTEQGIDSYSEIRINVNESIFEKIDSGQKAYWLGFLYADGSVIHDNIRYCLELSLKEADYEHLVKFKAFMETDAKIKLRKINLNGKVYNAFRILIFSKKITSDLIALGCIPNKSLTLKFPPKMIVPKEFLSDFIRGYFDGDGTLYVPKNLSNSRQPIIEILGTKEFLLDLRRAANLTSTKLRTHGQAFGTIHGGIIQTYKFLNEIYNNSTLYLERKYQKYKTLIDKLDVYYAQSQNARLNYKKKTGKDFL